MNKQYFWTGQFRLDHLTGGDWRDINDMQRSELTMEWPDNEWCEGDTGIVAAQTENSINTDSAVYYTAHPGARKDKGQRKNERN